MVQTMRKRKKKKVTELPPAGYSVGEVEEILGIPYKMGYKLIKDKKLEAFEDSCGMLRVSPYELYSYIKQQEK